MAEPPAGQETEENDQSFARRSWKWLAGAVLAGLAVVVGGYVVDANHWLQHKVSGPEQVLSAVVTAGDPSDVCNGQTGYVFPAKPDALPLPPNNPKSNRWAIENRGVPASGNYVNVVLQGLGGKTVVVTDLRVQVVTRRPPPAGSYPVGGGCGGLVPVLFEADLDTSPVKIKPESGVDEANNKIPAVALPHTVSESNPEVWHIAAVTSKCDCDWVAFVDYTADGKPGQVKLTNHGKPFRVAALAHVTTVVQDGLDSPHWTVIKNGH